MFPGQPSRVWVGTRSSSTQDQGVSNLTLSPVFVLIQSDEMIAVAFCSLIDCTGIGRKHTRVVRRGRHQLRGIPRLRPGQGAQSVAISSSFSSESYPPAVAFCIHILLHLARFLWDRLRLIPIQSTPSIVGSLLASAMIVTQIHLGCSAPGKEYSLLPVQNRPFLLNTIGTRMHYTMTCPIDTSLLYLIS